MVPFQGSIPALMRSTCRLFHYMVFDSYCVYSYNSKYNQLMPGSNHNRRDRRSRSLSSNSYHPNRSPSFDRTPTKSKPFCTRNRQPSACPSLQRKQLDLMKRMRRIDRLQGGGFKRANNNCQRKYISGLRNQLKPYLRLQIQNDLAQKYCSLSNSRVYFFVLLTYIKWLLEAEQIMAIYQGFVREMEGKIASYSLQMRNSRNDNFRNFRRDQIVELKSAKESIRYFLKDYNQEAIRILFLKDKQTIVKKEDYFKALLLIKDLEREFASRGDVRAVAMKINGLQLEDLAKERDSNHVFFCSDKERSISQNGSFSNQVQMAFKEPAYKNEKSQHRQTLHPKPSSGHCASPLKQQAEILCYPPLFELQNSIGSSDYFLLNRMLLQRQKKMQFRIESRCLLTQEGGLKVLSRTLETTGLTEMVKTE